MTFFVILGHHITRRSSVNHLELGKRLEIPYTVETYKSLQNFKPLRFFGGFCRLINRYDFFGRIF